MIVCAWRDTSDFAEWLSGPKLFEPEMPTLDRLPMTWPWSLSKEQWDWLLHHSPNYRWLIEETEQPVEAWAVERYANGDTRTKRQMDTAEYTGQMALLENRRLDVARANSDGPLWDSLAAYAPTPVLEELICEPGFYRTRRCDLWGEQLLWRCSRNLRHVWLARLHNRVRAESGCPSCWRNGTSRREQEIFDHLRALMPGLQLHGRVTRTHLGPGQRKRRDWRVDFLLPGDPVVVIEYDGAYWHAGKEARDMAKTDDLTKGGAVAIRIREHPLQRLGEFDVAVTGLTGPREVAIAVAASITQATAAGIV